MHATARRRARAIPPHARTGYTPQDGGDAMSSAAPAPIHGIREAAYPACLARLGGTASTSSPASAELWTRPYTINNAIPAELAKITGAQQVRGGLAGAAGNGGAALTLTDCAGASPDSRGTAETRCTRMGGYCNKQNVEQKAVEETRRYTSSPTSPSTPTSSGTVSAADGGDAAATAYTSAPYACDEPGPARAFQCAAVRASLDGIGVLSLAAADVPMNFSMDLLGTPRAVAETPPPSADELRRTAVSDGSRWVVETPQNAQHHLLRYRHAGRF